MTGNCFAVIFTAVVLVVQRMLCIKSCHVNIVRSHRRHKSGLSFVVVEEGVVIVTIISPN